MNIAGMRVFFVAHALEATDERLFPASRHRSKRIYKKLVQRFGGEFRKRPCIWQINGAIYAHPSFRAEFEKEEG